MGDSEAFKDLGLYDPNRERKNKLTSAFLIQYGTQFEPIISLSLHPKDANSQVTLQDVDGSIYVAHTTIDQSESRAGESTQKVDPIIRGNAALLFADRRTDQWYSLELDPKEMFLSGDTIQLQQGEVDFTIPGTHDAVKPMGVVIRHPENESLFAFFPKASNSQLINSEKVSSPPVSLTIEDSQAGMLDLTDINYGTSIKPTRVPLTPEEREVEDVRRKLVNSCQDFLRYLKDPKSYEDEQEQEITKNQEVGPITQDEYGAGYIIPFQLLRSRVERLMHVTSGEISENTSTYGWGTTLVFNKQEESEGRFSGKFYRDGYFDGYSGRQITPIDVTVFFEQRTDSRRWNVTFVGKDADEIAGLFVNLRRMMTNRADREKKRLPVWWTGKGF